MTPFERTVLAVGGLLATGIGMAILFAPGTVHAGHGVALGNDPSLLSEIRAPGALLFVLGGVMTATAIVRAAPAGLALAAGAVLYLSYFAGRGVSMVLDGRPHDGLIVAAALELAVGSLFAIAFLRRYRTAQGAPQRA